MKTTLLKPWLETWQSLKYQEDILRAITLLKKGIAYQNWAPIDDSYAELLKMASFLMFARSKKVKLLKI